MERTKVVRREQEDLEGHGSKWNEKSRKGYKWKRNQVEGKKKGKEGRTKG